MDAFSSCDGEPPATSTRPPLCTGKFQRCLCLLWTFVLACSPTSSSAAVQQGKGRNTSSSDSQDKRDTVLLDLTKKETFVPLQINTDPEEVEIAITAAKNLPSPHRLIPREGIVQYGKPVDIMLKEPPGVRIRLSLVTRGDELALRVSPQVILQGGETIELTQHRIARAARSLQRWVKDLHQRLSTLASARRRLHTWLISPGNKPLAAVKTARMRLKVLDQEIQLQQLELPVAQNQSLMLQRIAEFAGQLEEQAEIRFTVRTRRAGRAGRNGGVE